MQTQTEEKFSQYYEKWLYQLQQFLPHLVGASRESRSHADLQDLVSKLTAHHKEYYTEKWAAAHVEVLPFFSPSWWTPLENAYSWVTGWKPSTVFRLVASIRKTSSGGGLAGLSEEQVKKIEQLRVKIRYEEARIEREMERQQVGLADRKVVVGGMMTEAAMSSISVGLERLMKCADCVRLMTLKGLLDLLTPLQCIELLAAVSVLQIQLRQWGNLKQQQRIHFNLVNTS